jgi:uncharacterized protein
MSTLVAREMHRFEAASRPFAYMVPSAAIFALDDIAGALLDALHERPHGRDELVDRVSARFDRREVTATLAELVNVRAIGEAAVPEPPPPKIIPLTPFPLTTMVLNVTNQCNLSCTYCYEYGEDKIVDTKNGKKPKFMTEDTARESVEFLLRESGEHETAHLTFFGGETLMNFPVLSRTMRGAAPPKWASASTSA